MEHYDSLISYEFHPTFLFTQKIVRTRDEESYHAHEHLELAFIMSGRGRYRIDDELYDVEEGDLLILNPGTYHQALVSAPACPATEFFIGASDFRFEGMEENHLDLRKRPVLRTDGELKQKLMRLIISMCNEGETRRAGRYYMMQSLLVQFMLTVLRSEREPDLKPGKSYSFESINKKEIVSQIIDYFEQHYDEKLSLDIISENMYVSPFYISKIFKSVTGDTPIRYLIDIRLQKARELLEKYPEMSVHEVAERTGYDDAYHFSKLFKKKYGISPSRVRKTE